MSGIRLKGTGSALPRQVVTNRDLQRIVETDDAWIVSRTGIRERRFAQGETLTQLAVAAARRAMERREEQARHEKNLRRGKKRTAPPEPPQPVQEPPREAAKEKPRRPARPGRRRPAAPQQRFAGSRPVKKGKGSGRDRKKS